jgi:hypothetical protein
MAYYLFILAVGIEHLAELAVARRNTRWSIAHGGTEFNRNHYPAIAIMHGLLLVACIVEVWALYRPFIPWLGWPMVAVVLFSTVVCWWCLAVLGKYWNTRIIVIPGRTAGSARTVPLDAPPQLRRAHRASTGSLGMVDRDRVQHRQCPGTHRADPRRERRIGLRLIRSPRV